MSSTNPEKSLPQSPSLPPPPRTQEEKLFIISATVISIKVTQCLKHLLPELAVSGDDRKAEFVTKEKETRQAESTSIPSPSDPLPPRVVLLCAKSKNASKAISIAEIVKRRIEEQGLEWFQYNAIEEDEKPLPPKKNVRIDGSYVQPSEKTKNKEQKKRNNNTEDKDGTGSEDDPFERLPTPLPGNCEPENNRKRVVPILKIYLSRTRIEEYAKIYSEQCKVSPSKQNE